MPVVGGGKPQLLTNLLPFLFVEELEADAGIHHGRQVLDAAIEDFVESRQVGEVFGFTLPGLRLGAFLPTAIGGKKSGDFVGGQGNGDVLAERFAVVFGDFVFQDAIQPGLWLAFIFKRSDAFGSSKEGFLHEVLGKLPVGGFAQRPSVEVFGVKFYPIGQLVFADGILHVAKVAKQSKIE